MSIKDMINASVVCSLCGTKGYGKCDCWVQCPACRCMHERGKACARCNPAPGEPIRATHVGTLPADLFTTPKRRKKPRGAQK